MDNQWTDQEIFFSFNQSSALAEQELYQLAENSYPHGSPWSVDIYKSELTGTYNEYGIAVHKNKKIGFIGYTLLFDEAEITTFGILTPFKNQGIGQLFLRSFIEYLKAKKIKKLFLEVREQNKGAIAVYKKIGFETIAVRKNYYHGPVDHALIMQLSI